MPKINRFGYTRCPYCSWLMPATSLAKHIRRMHGTQTQPAKPARPSKPPVDPDLQEVVTCPRCKLKMQRRYLEGHQKLHEQGQKIPVPTRSTVRKVDEMQPPGQAKAEPKSLRTGDQKNQPKQVSQGPVEEQWYRDSDGELCFGIRPENELHKHLVDTSPSAPRQSQATAKQAEASRARSFTIPPGQPKTPAHKKIVSCPICQNLMQKSQLSKHILAHPGIMECPACKRVIREVEFAYHMESHPNWCPVCRLSVDELNSHLKRGHQLRLAEKKHKFYQPAWETKPLFTCDRCQKRISLVDYQWHQKNHEPVPEPARQAIASKKADRNKFFTCPFCQKDIVQAHKGFHIASEHSLCPYCDERVALRDLKLHIEANHPGKTLPS